MSTPYIPTPGDAGPGSDRFIRETGRTFTMRIIVSRAFIPLGIDKDTAQTILEWAVGQDVATLDFSQWPDRIGERLGLVWNIRDIPVFDVMRKIALMWLEEQKKIRVMLGRTT